MGQLFYSDRGRALWTHNEEITRWRWARKRFDLPAAAVGASADLWLYASPYAARGGLPLEVLVNGRPRAAQLPMPEMKAQWAWYRVPLGCISRKRVEVELRADTGAMNGWMLGLDPTVPAKSSDLSFDQGRTWQHEAMGACQALCGEYLIRLRSHAPSLREPAPPPVTYEQADHPRLRELRAMLPAAIRRQRDPQRQVRLLRSWVASQWTHDPFGRSYAPWDPLTIFDWAHRPIAHGHRGRVAMCVHFGVVMMSMAAALGRRARCIAITRDINSEEGHFVAEIFDPQRGRWVVHDANYDVHYENGGPLSACDLADRALAGVDLRRNVVCGESFPRGPRRLVRMFHELFGPGVSYRCVGVWANNQFISDPSAAPPNHGSITYAETDWIWYSPAPHDLTPMFPCHAVNRRYFDRP